MKVKIEIDTATFVRLFLVAAGFVVAVLVLWKLLPALMIVLISLFLAIALNPPVSFLAKRLPSHSRVLATAVSYLVVLSVIGFFVYVAVPPITRQTTSFINSLPTYIDQVSTQSGVVADIVKRYNLQDDVNNLVEGARSQVGVVGGTVVSGVTSVLNGFVTTITMLVLTFLALVEGPKWLERLWRVYVDKRKLEHHKELIGHMYHVITRYVTGQVFVATLAGAAGLLVLFALTSFFPVPITAVLPLTFLIFLTELVPLIGALIGAAIVVLVLLFSDVGAAIAFIVYFVIYQQIETNLIQPTVQSRTIELSALAILVAILIGINLLGPIGALLAIPAAGCIRVLLIDYFERRKERLAAQRHHGSGRLVQADKVAEL